MVGTQKDKGEKEPREAAAESLAEASARLIADQTAVMTMMTAVSVNIATQMAGMFMGAVADALEKREPATAKEKEVQAEKPNVVPLRVVKKAGAPKADDLKRISGIGPRLEKALHDLGVRTLADIAGWDDADVQKVDEKLGLEKRIIRDGWVKQAKALLEG